MWRSPMLFCQSGSKGQRTRPRKTKSRMTRLFLINPDNSSSSTVLSATTQNETQYPRNIIPDGNGGVLATWSVSMVRGTQLTNPYQAVDVSGGAVGTPYNLPSSPQAVDITRQPDLIL